MFNALIIPALVPLALGGVRYRPMAAGPLLARNLSVFGLGGLVAPFAGIKLIDLAVSGLHLACGAFHAFRPSIGRSPRTGVDPALLVVARLRLSPHAHRSGSGVVTRPGNR